MDSHTILFLLASLIDILKISSNSTADVSTVLKAIYFKVNSRALADLSRNQKFLRLSNRSCVFNELNAIDDGQLSQINNINWRGDRTLKILEAIWYTAPLCADFFDDQCDKYFESLKQTFRNQFYVEVVDCFKYELVKINSTGLHPLLIGFESNKFNTNSTLITECENIVKEFFRNFLNPQVEGIKVEYKVLKIRKCNENFYIQKHERKLNLIKVAIVANTLDRIPVKYLKITKHEFRGAMKRQGRIMRDCLLKDVWSYEKRD